MKELSNKEFNIIQDLIDAEIGRLEKLDREDETVEALRQLDAISTKLFGPPVPGYPTPDWKE